MSASIRMPAVNQRVTLVVDGLDAHLETRVEDTDGNALTLAIPSDGAGEVELPRGSRLAIEWVTARGLASVEGRVRGPGSLHIRTIVVDPVGAPGIIQRREHVRTQAVLDIVATPLVEGGEPVWGTTIDISGGGVQARLPELELEVGGRVDLGIAVPGVAETVYGTTQVMRRVEPDLFTLAFDQITVRDQERIIKYVFARLRATMWMAA